MPVIELTNDQAKKLLRQLPPLHRADLFIEMAADEEVRRAERLCRSDQAFRRVCIERGYEPDAMTEDEKMDLVCEIVHED